MTATGPLSISPRSSTKKQQELCAALQELHYKTPKRCPHDKNVKLAHAYTGDPSARERFRVLLSQVALVSNQTTADGKTRDLVLRASEDQVARVMDLDQAFLDHALEHVPAWFDNLDPVFVHQYFRSSTMVNRKHGVCVRLFTVASDRIDALLQDHRDADGPGGQGGQGGQGGPELAFGQPARSQRLREGGQGGQGP